MKDNFFSKQKCDRCGSKLEIRIMSWFTNETLCMDCATKESEIKENLRAKGKSDMEGCGYIPTV